MKRDPILGNPKQITIAFDRQRVIASSLSLALSMCVAVALCMTGIHLVSFLQPNSIRRIALIISKGNTSEGRMPKESDAIHSTMVKPCVFPAAIARSNLSKSVEAAISPMPSVLMETVDVRVYQ